MAFIFIVVLILLLLSDAYVVFCALPGVMVYASSWAKILIYIAFLFPTLLNIALNIKVFLSGDFSQHLLNSLFRGTLLVVITTLIFVVISLIGKAVGLIWPCATRMFNILGLVVAIVWSAIVLYNRDYFHL